MVKDFVCFYQEVTRCTRGFPCSSVVKNLPAKAGDVKTMDSVPGSGRFPGGGHGNSLQYSCLENPMDGGVWWARVHRIAKESDTTEAT